MIKEKNTRKTLTFIALCFLPQLHLLAAEDIVNGKNEDHTQSLLVSRQVSNSDMVITVNSKEKYKSTVDLIKSKLFERSGMTMAVCFSKFDVEQEDLGAIEIPETLKKQITFYRYFGQGIQKIGSLSELSHIKNK